MFARKPAWLAPSERAPLYLPDQISRRLSLRVRSCTVPNMCNVSAYAACLMTSLSLSTASCTTANSTKYRVTRIERRTIQPSLLPVIEKASQIWSSIVVVTERSGERTFVGDATVGRLGNAVVVRRPNRAVIAGFPLEDVIEVVVTNSTEATR